MSLRSGCGQVAPSYSPGGGRKQNSSYLPVFDHVANFLHQHSVVSRIIVLSLSVAICWHIVPKLSQTDITAHHRHQVISQYQNERSFSPLTALFSGDKTSMNHLRSFSSNTFFSTDDHMSGSIKSGASLCGVETHGIAGWTTEWIPFSCRRPWSICTWQWHQQMSPKLHLCGKGRGCEFMSC